MRNTLPASGSGPRTSLAHGLRPWLELVRLPNLFTAVADVAAGYAVAGLPGFAHLPWLLVSTVGLYAGGVVLNDVFDAGIDARERPERPIPRGHMRIADAALFGIALLSGGIAAASRINPLAALIAALIALGAVVYDAWLKHRPVIGAVNMGTLRGMNLLLGLSATPLLFSSRWVVALLSVTYIAAVTALSRGEVHGGNRRITRLATALFAAVGVGLPVLILELELSSAQWWSPLGSMVVPLTDAWAGILASAPFLALVALRLWPALRLTGAAPRPEVIRQAVRAGVLALVALDAAIAAGCVGPIYGLLVLSLLLAATATARRFAVT